MNTQSPMSTPPTRTREFAEGVSPSYNVERLMAAAHKIETAAGVAPELHTVIDLAAGEIPCNKPTTYAVDRPVQPCAESTQLVDASPDTTSTDSGTNPNGDVEAGSLRSSMSDM